MRHPVTMANFPPHSTTGTCVTINEATHGGIRRDLDSTSWINHHRGLATSVAYCQQVEEQVGEDHYPAVDPDRLVADLEFATQAGPGVVLSHTSAWRFYGYATPASLNHDDTTFVSVKKGFPRVKRNTVTCVRRSLMPLYETFGDLKVTTPAQTWVDLAKLRPGVEALVICAEQYVGSDGERIRHLEQLVARSRRAAGVQAARQAVQYVRAGSESPQETRMRYRLMKSGLQCPAIQHDVFDHTGHHVARLDTAYPGFKVAVEYQGAHHLSDSVTRVKDRIRQQRLESLGWQVVSADADDLIDPAENWIDAVRFARRRRSL